MQESATDAESLVIEPNIQMMNEVVRLPNRNKTRRKPGAVFGDQQQFALRLFIQILAPDLFRLQPWVSIPANLHEQLPQFGPVFRDRGTYCNRHLTFPLIDALPDILRGTLGALCALARDAP
ncbi:hypothetical protein GQ56_0106725 [Burkholderia paludis]|nr:hypothetical protein GQ56_0106725 [Burkholderia paludis]